MWSAAINGFDFSILHWLNALVGRSVKFDAAVVFMADNDIKGAAFVSVFWWYFLRKTDAATTARTRDHVLRSLCAGMLAIVAARALALTLPFRVRPRFEPALHIVVPPDSFTSFVNWSSFPSDHVAMFSALAVGLWFISWRAGLLALLYTTFIIGLPRIYLGIHYPTDEIVALALGGVIGYWMNVTAVCRPLTSRALRWESASPGSFYWMLFIVTFEFSTMFDSLRIIALQALHFVAYIARLL